MIKKIFFVFGLALMAQLIVACVDCDCPPYREFNFTNKGISLNNLDASLPQPKVTNASTISSANYGVRIQLLTEVIAWRKKTATWGFMQSAYACSCAEDDYRPKEKIISLEIFSNNDFDATHPKNTDLSLYFNVKQNSGMVSIAKYLDYIREVTYLARYPFNEGVFLLVPPNINKKHKFRFKMTLSDGRILEAETTEIELV